MYFFFILHHINRSFQLHKETDQKWRMAYVSLILKLESSLISSNFSINLILRDIQTFHNIFHPTWFAKDIRRWKRGEGGGEEEE